jgi:hypothetical protein
VLQARHAAISRLVMVDTFIPRDGDTMAGHIAAYPAAAADDRRVETGCTTPALTTRREELCARWLNTILRNCAS